VAFASIAPASASALATSLAPSPMAPSAPRASVAVFWSAASEDVGASTRVCALRDGRFEVTTRTSTPLPEGWRLAEDLVIGTSQGVVDHVGATWEGDQSTPFVAIGEHGVARIARNASGVARGGSGASAGA
jgi:hypothetical protein